MANNRQQEAVEQPLVTPGNVSLNLGNYQSSVDGQPVQLTYDEFELLALLVDKADRVIPYDLIARHLWDHSGHGPVRHLNVLIHRLRTKLGSIQPYEITTVRGRGYGLILSPQAR